MQTQNESKEIVGKKGKAILSISYSFFPQYSRTPRYNLAHKQPSDHMSMASVRGRPKKTSGDLQRVQQSCNFQAGAIYFPSVFSYSILCSFLRPEMMVCPYLQHRGWMTAPFATADTLLARPKSMSLTLNGCNLWLTNITLSILMSVCMRPMLLNVWRAVASWDVVGMLVNSQHRTAFMAFTARNSVITTCWTITLIDFRGKGWYDRASMKAERVCSRYSKTRQ